MQTQSDQGSMENSLDNNFSNQIGKLIHTGGTLKITEAEKKKLYKEFKPTDIMIKYDGTVYAPWTEYVTRLNDAFSGGGWAMVPQGNPIQKGGNVYWGFHMMIRGCYCGFAYGFCETGRLEWGNVIESAKSNALMRLCKELGIGLKLWEKDFIEDWKKKYAYQGEDGRWYKGQKPKAKKGTGDNVAKGPAALGVKDRTTVSGLAIAAQEDLPEQTKPEVNDLEKDISFLLPILNQELPNMRKEAELKERWDSLEAQLQSDSRVAEIFATHVERIRKLPEYGPSTEEQQRAIKDYIQEIKKYKTATEVKVNLDFDIKTFVKKGFMKENADALRRIALAEIAGRETKSASSQLPVK